jgi:glycosyltransferase involved in cell wall biosynthesis
MDFLKPEQIKTHGMSYQFAKKHSRMNVGIFLGNIDPHDGGGFVFQHEILKELQSVNKTSYHFTLLYRGKVVPRYSLNSLSIEPPFFFRLKSACKGLFKKHQSSYLDAVLFENKIDIVWFPTYQFEPVNVPYIFTVWDLQHRLQPFFPEVSLNGQFESRENLYNTALKRASFVLTGTDRGAHEISIFFQVHPDRIRRLPHPVPRIAALQPAPLHELFPGDIPKYLFYPAQFWPHKNHIVILEALLQLKKNGKIISLVLVGSDKGVLKSLSNKISEFGLSDQVYFLGFLSSEQIAALYKGAFALVYATLFGPENLPPLEAFAMGCPAIVSDVPGAREQYGHAAAYFDPLKSESLVEQIEKLMTNDAWRLELIASGFKRAAMYSANHYVKDILKILDEFSVYRRTWD